MRKKEKQVETPSVLGDVVAESTTVAPPAKVTDVPGKKTSLWRPIGIVAAVVVVLAGIFVGGGIYFEKQYQDSLTDAEKKEAKEGMTYFQAEVTTPEKSETEITALITQAYYTNDGSLAVHLCFGNGMSEDKHLVSVEVKIRNGDEKTVAAGYSDAIADDFVIPKDGTKELVLYISPEYVEISDDSLHTISYDITTKYESVG